jgi:soluble lytic murein transglycosylase-like protein
LSSLPEPTKTDEPRKRGMLALAPIAALVGLLVVASLPQQLAPLPVSPPAPAPKPIPLQDRLAQVIAERYSVALPKASLYASAMVTTAEETGADPLIYAAIAGVESSYREQVRSGYGAVGLMQVVPRVHQTRFQREGLSVYKPADNIKIGGAILDEYLDWESGNMTLALQRYNGALRDKTRKYANKVFTEYQSINALVRGPATPKQENESCEPC